MPSARPTGDRAGRGHRRRARPQVRDLLGDGATCVEQAAPLGTGDAVRSVPAELRSDGPVLVLVRRRPAHPRRDTRAAARRPRILAPRLHAAHSAFPTDPSGLGRVVRDQDGHVLRIVEERDFPPGEPLPLECNGGIYVFDGAQLWPALDRLTDRQRPGRVLPDRRRRAADRPGGGGGRARPRRVHLRQRSPPARRRGGGTPAPDARRPHAVGCDRRGPQRPPTSIPRSSWGGTASSIR